MGEASDWDSLFQTIARATGVVEEDVPGRTQPPAPPARRSPRRTTTFEATRAGASPRVAPAPAQRVGNSKTTIQVNLYGRLLGAGRNAGASPDAAAPAPPTLPVEAPAAASALPELAEMERQRKAKRKPPEGKRGRQKAIRTTKETVVPLERRLVEFPNECLKVSAGKLFCLPCKEELPNLKERIKRHTSCMKHQEKKAEFHRASKENDQLFSDLSEYFTGNSSESGAACRNQMRQVAHPLLVLEHRIAQLVGQLQHSRNLLVPC
ncbi:hypothetical protein AB1Y20_002945 [Prymnesium parvum]|uniref:Uncharacterized protein n=1 Tax=Prymnesium parvum TaxID=97485 RepID=A0AB34JBT9_PRYPA